MIKVLFPKIFVFVFEKDCDRNIVGMRFSIHYDVFRPTLHTIK